MAMLVITRPQQGWDLDFFVFKELSGAMLITTSSGGVQFFSSVRSRTLGHKGHSKKPGDGLELKMGWSWVYMGLYGFIWVSHRPICLQSHSKWECIRKVTSVSKPSLPRGIDLLKGYHHFGCSHWDPQKLGENCRWYRHVYWWNPNRTPE